MHGIPNGSVPLERMLVFHAHVDQRLREFRHNFDGLFDRLAAATNGSKELARRHQAVARGIVLEQNHMARLLATNGIAAFAHRLEHIAVAHLGLQHVNAMSLHGAHEAQIGHDGGNRRVMGQLAAILQIDRKHRLDDVAIDLGAVFRHEHHAVGIAIVGNAHVSAAFGHKLGQGAQMGGAAIDVDVGAVIVVVDHGDFRTQTTQRLCARERRRAVARIERNVEPVEVDSLARHRFDRMVDIHLACVLDFKSDANLVAHGHFGFLARLFRTRNLALNAALGNEFLDFIFDRVRKLEAIRVEELDAVVLRRIMRCGNHDAAIGMQFANQQRHGRRRNNSRKQRIAARTRNAGNHRRLEHVAAFARIFAHDNGLAHKRCRSLPKPIRQFAGKVDVRHTTHAIGSKKSGHCFSNPCESSLARP